MSWINKHRKIFRVIILALLVLAIMGPWLFDVIYVPAEYECHAPYIRLKDDFCGIPLSGIRFLLWMVPGCVFLILLPLFSTVLLILIGERRSLQIFNAVTWGLALGLCLLMWLKNDPNLFWVLWGLWLYSVVAAAALVLEILLIQAGKSTSA